MNETLQVPSAPPFCVICRQSGEMSTEHVIARQIRRLLGIKEPVKEYIGSKYIRRDETLAIVLRNVCVTCNNGWLDHLDRKVMPVLEPILLGAAPGTHRILDPATQATLATWAVKVSLLLMLSKFRSHESGWIPQCSLDWLRRNYAEGIPPPGTRVWLGGVNTNNTPSWFRAACLYDDKKQPAAHFGTFSVGCDVFQVFCCRQEDASLSPENEVFLAARGPYQSSLLQIAPSISSVHWPPENVFTVDALPVLAGRLQDGLSPVTQNS